MMRTPTRAIACATILGAIAACDGGKKVDEEPAAKPTATAAAAPTPPPAPEPVPEEPPKKKEPRVCTPSKTVDFAGNAALEKEVRFKLSKPEGDVAVSELAKIKSLNLSQTKVDELDPCIFPKLKNAKEVFLGAGKLDDLGPLAELKNLESLRASLNKVENVKPLEGLIKMDRLDLGHTQVKDISPLAKLENLTDLQLDDTLVSDLTPLAGLKKLERLSIQRTGVKDVSPLKTCESLKFIYVSGAPVDDLSVLGALRGRGLKIVE